MSHVVLFHPAFAPEFRDLDLEVKKAVGEVFDLLRDNGPSVGRPNVDTLNGSKHANMKEIRIDAVNGAWRFAFAFDRERQAVVLYAGDKTGVSSDQFYRTLIAKADRKSVV